MNYNRSPTQHTGKVAHAGHAPPKFRSPTNTTSNISTSSLSYIRRPLPSAPRNKDSPNGLSDSQVNTTARLRSFEHHIPLKHDVKYIYAVNPSSPNIVYFFEYRGYGIPSETFGDLGDIYVDLTPNCYAVYARDRVGWARWTAPAWLEHPFLTDTILSFLYDSLVWVHPTTVDKHVHDADIRGSVHDMLAHEAASPRGDQAPSKQPETDSRDDLDAMAAGNGSRKRPRVDEELSFTEHNFAAAASPTTQQPVQIEGEPIRVESAPAEIPSTAPQTDRISPSYQLHKRKMDLRICGLQEEMTKIQADLRELQTENARVTRKNEKLQEEVEMLRDMNAKTKRDNEERVAVKGRSMDSARALDVSSLGGARGQPGPDGAISTCAGSNEKHTRGLFGQLLNHGSNTGASKTDGLSADIRNRLLDQANNYASFMDEVIEANLNIQRLVKTVADQKLHIATLSAELQRHEEVRGQIDRERKEHEERLRAMDAWLMVAPKFSQDLARRTGG